MVAIATTTAVAAITHATGRSTLDIAPIVSQTCSAVQSASTEPPMRTALAAIALALALPAPAHAWTVSSPDRSIAATVTRAGNLTASRHGRTVLRADLGPLHGTRVRRSRLTTRFTTPAGKRRRHTLRARVLKVGGVAVLAADDGIAVRGTTTWIARGRAWLQRFSSSYENPYRRTPLRHAGRYGFPALLSTGRDWALLTEAGVPYGAPGGHLRAIRNGRLRTTGDVRAWRIAVIGSLQTIVASDLPLALGRPSRINDPSWIRPGRAAWSWWSDSASTRSLARQEQFVDFAAAEHFEYATVDAGWDAAWVPDLEAYAAARNVRLILWTDWHALADPARRAATLDRWAGWGIAGIKVDYLQSDGGRRMAVDGGHRPRGRAPAARRRLPRLHGPARSPAHVAERALARGGPGRRVRTRRRPVRSRRRRRPRLHAQRDRLDGLHAGDVLGAPTASPPPGTSWR